MPLTGGGASTITKASCTADSRCRSEARISGALWCCPSRCSNVFSPEKMVPALDALVRLAPSRPANTTALRTPGVSRMIRVTSRTTASVRVSDAPGGSCITVIR